MNKDFYLYEDKAIVSDENGSVKEVDNGDNIGEVLQQENIVEALRNEIISLCDEKNNQKNPIYYGLGKTAFIACSIGSITGVLVMIILNGISLLGLIFLLCFAVVLTTGGSLPFFLIDYIKYKKYLDSQEYLEHIIAKLRSKHEIESKKLVSLNEEMKKVNTERKTGVCNVNNEEVERINDETTNSIEFSRDVVKYLKYYRKGLLSKKLGREKANAYSKQIEDNVLYLIKRI